MPPLTLTKKSLLDKTKELLDGLKACHDELCTTNDGTLLSSFKKQYNIISDDGDFIARVVGHNIEQRSVDNPFYSIIYARGIARSSAALELKKRDSQWQDYKDLDYLQWFTKKASEILKDCRQNLVKYKNFIRTLPDSNTEISYEMLLKMIEPLSTQTARLVFGNRLGYNLVDFRKEGWLTATTAKLLVKFDFASKFQNDLQYVSEENLAAIRSYEGDIDSPPYSLLSKLFAISKAARTPTDNKILITFLMASITNALKPELPPKTSKEILDQLIEACAPPPTKSSTSFFKKIFGKNPVQKKANPVGQIINSLWRYQQEVETSDKQSKIDFIRPWLLEIAKDDPSEISNELHDWLKKHQSYKQSATATPLFQHHEEASAAAAAAAAACIAQHYGHGPMPLRKH